MINKLYIFVALFAVTLFSGCELIGDIFKAGAYTALIGVVIVIALILWIVSKFRKS